MPEFIEQIVKMVEPVERPLVEKSDRIRVLQMVTNLPVGGAQEHTLITIEKLDRKLFEVSLLCAPDGQWLERAQNIADLNLIFVNQLTRNIHLVNDLIAFIKIYQAIKKVKYDIVHTNSSKPGVLGRIAAKLAGVPVIVHTIHGFPFHDFMSPVWRNFLILIERFLSSISDKLITVSTLNLEKALRLRLAERCKFHNIYSGIDFAKFDIKIDPEQKKRELGIPKTEKIVGMVGRLSEQKAPLDLVKAMPEVLRFNDSVRFVMVGDGELREKTITLAKKLRVDSKLMILGFREDVPELLQIFDVFVLSSLWEGLARTLIEAMYVGLAVVATNVEGIPELVKDETTGILVPPKDIAALSKGIIAFLSDEKKAQKLGATARQQITDLFRADRMVHTLETVYKQALLEKGVRIPTTHA